MENAIVITSGVIILIVSIIALIWIFSTPKKQPLVEEIVKQKIEEANKAEKASKLSDIDEKAWTEFMNNPDVSGIVLSSDEKPIIILESNADDFSEPHMETVKPTDIIKETITSIKNTPEIVEPIITESKQYPEIIEKPKRKYNKKVKADLSVFDKKLYNFGNKGVGDIEISNMVLWNNKISKVTELKGKKAYICTFIKGEEVCKMVNVNALAIATLKQ